MKHFHKHSVFILFTAVQYYSTDSTTVLSVLWYRGVPVQTRTHCTTNVLVWDVELTWPCSQSYLNSFLNSLWTSRLILAGTCAARVITELTTVLTAPPVLRCRHSLISQAHFWVHVCLTACMQGPEIVDISWSSDLSAHRPAGILSLTKRLRLVRVFFFFFF